MGIPQLLSQLEKIQKPKTKLYPETPNPGSDATPIRPAAVIDGSALAYYIFNRYIKTLGKDERIPGALGVDYSIYQSCVINWLERLEVGFEITHIFTDGHLPSYKAPTRISRIQSTTTNLSRLRTLSPSTIDLSKVNWTPSPPFLIAAFSAAIRGHVKFKDLIKTVPGEADSFCAAAARAYNTQGGGDFCVIFTGDSDLLVYPCAAHTRIATLDQVVFEDPPAVKADTNVNSNNGNENNKRKVKVVLWSPWDIEQKLGGNSEGDDHRILKFAWCISTEILKAVKIVGSGKYDALTGVKVGKEFKEQYLLPDLGGIENAAGGLSGILDSRAAEAVYASPKFKSLCHPPVTATIGPAEIYLPALLEDITKSSVWSAGREVRKMAYRMLFGRDASVIEVHRKGEAVNKTLIHLNEPSDDELKTKDTAVEGINDLLVRIVLEIARGYQEKSMPLTDTDVIALLAAITPSSTETSLPQITATHWTWPRAHLLSQLTAGIWSIYLLQTVATLPNLTAIELTDEKFFTNLQTSPSLLKAINTARFITIYAISPDRRGMSKNAKKRARKRAKVAEGQDTAALSGVQGMINRMFGREVRGSVAAVLKVVAEMGRSQVDDEDGGDDEVEEAESYMGMTVG